MERYARTRAAVRRSFRARGGVVRGAWELFFDQLKGAKLVGISENRTGSQTVVRLKVGGKRRDLRIETYRLRGGVETTDVFMDRIMEELIPNLRDVEEDVCDTADVLPVIERAGEVFGDLVRDEARARGIAVLDEALLELRTHDVGAKQAEYQRQGAVKDLRGATKRALALGVTLDEMHEVLKEESVRAVMES